MNRDDDRKPPEFSKEDITAIIAMMGAIKTTRVRKAIPVMA